MRRRRGGGSTRDDEFNRNNSRYSNNSSPLERQLFDPRSDNPIQFNNRTSTRDDTTRPTRRLWSDKDDETTPPRIMERRIITKNKETNNTSPKPQMKKKPDPGPMTEQDIKRRKLKSLIHSIQTIEASIAKVSTRQSTREEEPNSRHGKQSTVVITDQDVAEAESLYREKIKLHLQLGETYLEILKLDPDYAEKKGLESLCWKRAIYSLVDQFRTALKGHALQLRQQQQVGIALAKMTVTLFLEFLDDADAFYQHLSVFLKSLDDSEGETFQQWRRTRAYRWFSCIHLRGDLARYRWTYADDKPAAFQEAWRRYYLGVWLMPAKGNLYFNLSLLLPDGLHKLYFGVRSLMVRRNGFLNAREGVITLFESNRCWLTKQRKPTAIPLFIRMHGMLFTKIGLDEFPKTKRLFFESLFPPRRGGANQEEGKVVGHHLSSGSQFWFEMIVLCLSSLYTYDYANATLTKLISNQRQRLFYDGQGQELEEMRGNILFINGIDLTCQIAVEIFQAYLDKYELKAPTLLELPNVTLELKANEAFLFGSEDRSSEAASSEEASSDRLSELIYVEILLHWMVINGLCIQQDATPSLWEGLVGEIDYDLVFKGNTRHSLSHERRSNISPAFWSLLLAFLTRLLSELPDQIKYEMINHHFLDDDDEEEEEEVMEGVSKGEYLFSKDIFTLMGPEPELPEEQQLRGLGWVDEVHGRLLKLGFKNKKETVTVKDDNVMLRKLKILNYGFVLVKNLENVLCYDAVHEVFTVSKDVEERLVLDHQRQSSALMKNIATEEEEEAENDEEEGDTEMVSTISAMDDDVLLSNDTDYSIDEEDDDIMTQLKKRREQLQSMIVMNEKEQQTGYHRLPARVKERKARLNYLRQHIIPGKTVLVLDTNCFIGHIDLVKKLINAAKWSIVVPLVVVTELDGLRSSAQKLGSAAQQAIELIEGVLAIKQRQNQSLRVQTSHNNFMSDISIRSEQFIFGETDKNLDDLVLSACLWWVSQSHDKNTVPVCLVTGDRNLSVKARARDVEVAPVSAIMQLTPK